MASTSLSAAEAADPSSASSPNPCAPAPELMGAEILVRALQAEGVRHIWGYPGGAVLYIYDALYNQDSIEHILVRHEQAAVHAADGYARATGDVGVAILTSGPGATNGLTGIATAYMDSVPLVVITGQVATPLIGQDAFQECDTVGISRPVVKHNFLVKDAADLAVIIKKAFHIARTGRPGPVVVDIPKDISLQTAPWEGYPQQIRMRSYNPVLKGHSGQIRKALQLLLQAKRPYIYTGGGVLLGNACNELRELVNAIGCPITSTLMGLGAFPGTDKRFLGMLGMHGTVEANYAMQHCDVLLAIGARFDDRVVGNLKHFNQMDRKVIHVDIDPSTISKRVRVDIPIVGDVKEVLSDMLIMLRDTGGRPDAGAMKAWWDEVQTWRAHDCLKYTQPAGGPIKPQTVIETLWRLTHGQDVYICSDVGQHQMWLAQYYKFDEPRRWINSGGLGTMGVGLPFGMGIKKALPQAEVFCVTGDGSIQMNIQELATCAQFNTPLKIIMLNNGYLGMVRQWQEIQYASRYSHVEPTSPDYVKLCDAYGHIGMVVERPEDLEPALQEARRLKDRTVFLDIRVDPAENVLPMVLAGKGLTEMLRNGANLC